MLKEASSIQISRGRECYIAVSVTTVLTYKMLMESSSGSNANTDKASRRQAGGRGRWAQNSRTPLWGPQSQPCSSTPGGFDGIGGRRAAGQSSPGSVTSTHWQRPLQSGRPSSIRSLILGPQLGGRGEGPRDVTTTGKQWWPQVNQCLQDDRPGSQCSSTLNSLNPPKNMPERYWFVIPFYRQGNRGTEQLSDWPESYNR